MTQDKESLLIDLTRNKNQAAFFRDVMHTVAGVGPRYRYFSFGGAIRGGKTFVQLFILILLAKRYPRTRWHVIRATNSVLLSTTIPSFMKLKPASVEMRHSPQIKAIFPNGSVIYFMSENLSANPDLGALPWIGNKRFPVGASGRTGQPYVGHGKAARWLLDAASRSDAARNHNAILQPVRHMEQGGFL
jgi:hypothetical protein